MVVAFPPEANGSGSLDDIDDWVGSNKADLQSSDSNNSSSNSNNKRNNNSNRIRNHASIDSIGSADGAVGINSTSQDRRTQKKKQETTKATSNTDGASGGDDDEGRGGEKRKKGRISGNNKRTALSTTISVGNALDIATQSPAEGRDDCAEGCQCARWSNSFSGSSSSSFTHEPSTCMIVCSADLSTQDRNE